MGLEWLLFIDLLRKDRPMEREVKHTSGPWTIDAIKQKDAPFEFSVIQSKVYYSFSNEPSSKFHQVICTVEGDPNHNEANGRLIAAAPELLEALVNLVGNLARQNAYGDAETLRTFGRAEDAIAKATGGAP